MDKMGFQFFFLSHTYLLSWSSSYYPYPRLLQNENKRKLDKFCRACEGALRTPGRSDGQRGKKRKEKKRELSTTSPLSRCEMLIGADDISNDVNTLGTCFSMFAYILARFRFALIGESTGSHRGIEGGIQIQETQLQALLPFPVPPPERPGELARRLFLFYVRKKFPTTKKSDSRL